MKVSVDRSGCISCALCWTSCPEVFEEDSDVGMSCITEKYRKAGSIGEGDVPENLRADVASAADNCPVSVIHVE